MIEEKFYKWPDGSPGGWYKDDDGTKHELYDWDTMNKKENFESAVKKKGEFAWFSYTHNIGTYFNKVQDRSIWLGQESHYDEDHFFYITGVPGFEDKRIAFQLRVANHPTAHRQWEESHSEGRDGTGKIIRPDLKADFCLSLIMNPLGRKVDEYNSAAAVTVRVTSIDCNFDYYNKPKDEQEQIDAIIKQITDGASPTITFETVVSLFGGGNPRSTGPGEVRPHNFEPRKNQPFNRGTFFKFTKDAKKIVSANARSEVKIDELPNGIKDGDIIEIDGREYKYDGKNDVLYLKKTRRGNEFFDEETPIPIVLENVVKIGMEDIVEAVRRVLDIII